MKMDKALPLWENRYREANETGKELFPAEPHPLVVEALDQVRILTRHRPSAIDVGAGTGRHARELARRGYYVLAVEGAEAAVAAHTRTPAPNTAPDASIEWVRADVYDWTPPFNADVVLVSFFHERHDGILAALERVASWTCEDGWLVLVGHSRLQAGRKVGGPPYADALWDRAALETWLGEHGFEITVSEDVEHAGRCRDNGRSPSLRERGDDVPVSRGGDDVSVVRSGDDVPVSRGGDDVPESRAVEEERLAVTTVLVARRAR